MSSLDHSASHAGEILRERDRSHGGVIPGWLTSLVLHGAAVAVLLTTGLKGCIGSGNLGTADDGDFRDVGIYVKAPETANNDAPTPDNPTVTPADAVFPATSDTSTQKDVDDAPPVPLELPSATENPLLGAGAPPSFTPGDLTDSVPKVAGSFTPNRSPADPGTGETSFFNIRDKGSRFVYVLDCSGSMTNHNAIRVAKAELVASLESLDSKQQFQIIFYNQLAQSMKLRGDADSDMYWANDINRTLSRQYIAGVQADLGTDHMPALRKALKLSPEVMFFLTDADQPILTAKNLNEISRLNDGKSRIHCIEFGRGPELNVDNFLKKLARQNGGSYQYRDVTRFGKR